MSEPAGSALRSDETAFFGLCVGSSSWEHPGWANMDKVSDDYRDRQNRIDYHVDLFTDPFPIPDNSFTCVYISHVIEHLSDRVAQNTLAETLRVLKPGGIVRLATPDFDRIADAYHRRDRFFFTRFGFAKTHDETIHQRFVRTFGAGYVLKAVYPDLPKLDDDEIQDLFQAREKYLDTALMLTRDIPEGYNDYSPRGHMNVWTGARVQALLRDLGYRDSWVSWCQGSRSRRMVNRKVFDLTHPFMSLYVEGQK